MKKIVLLTGGGDLPEEVIKNLKKKKIKFFCIGFNNNPISKIIYKYNFKIINFGRIVTELKNLKLDGFSNILLIGNMRRPNLKEIKPDFNTIKLLPLFAHKLLQGGDNNILNFSITQLRKLGFKIADLRKIIPDNFLGLGNQTKVKITKINLSDINKGKMILDNNSKFDIGQSIIVQQGSVIGIEAAQGTDQLIKQSNSYSKNEIKSTLIKLVKIKQNLKVDLPTIGLTTLKNCKKYCINGIAYSANKTLFIKKNEIINFCNKNDIFLVGI
ncbi:MAG: UDP-2,3-diacylglucosamine diphosphatase LpxI [Pseudomonadota bacterium]|nr:UDP-2,3-diacylglucosamine diphosphatase LpxI [Pseudomonadota bacterium]